MIITDMGQQDSTNGVMTNSGGDKSVDKLADPRMQSVIDYYAVQGLMTDEEGNFKRMTVGQLAEKLGVDRTTIYNWRDAIPQFWERVDQSRLRLGGQNRVQKVWNGVYLQAAAGKPEQAKMFLANFDKNYKQPGQPTKEDTANTLIDLMNAARALQQEASRAQRPDQPVQVEQQPLTAAPMPIIDVQPNQEQTHVSS